VVTLRRMTEKRGASEPRISFALKTGLRVGPQRRLLRARLYVLTLALLIQLQLWLM
jgi:hypothetical protein